MQMTMVTMAIEIMMESLGHKCPRKERMQCITFYEKFIIDEYILFEK